MKQSSLFFRRDIVLALHEVVHSLNDNDKENQCSGTQNFYI